MIPGKITAMPSLTINISISAIYVSMLIYNVHTGLQSKNYENI